jgi:glycosyltransferase involved in cell wall biosynthesis
MAQEQPLVSVIIPTHNSAKYIKEAVDSVLAQTYSPIEILIGDGHSKDGTREILEPYIKKDLVSFFYQEGKGPGDGRNAALKHAKGEFVAFLDSVDIFLPTKIERQVAYFQAHPECDVCYCKPNHFYDDAPEKLLTLDYTYYSGADVLPHLLRRNFIAPSMLMARRSAVLRTGLFSEIHLRSEDWEYWVRLAYRGAVFGFLPETLLKIRVHRGSYSDGWEAKSAEKKISLRIFGELYRAMSHKERWRYHMGTLFFEHRAKLWYTYLGNHFPPLQWLPQWLLKNRLK